MAAEDVNVTSAGAAEGLNPKHLMSTEFKNRKRSNLVNKIIILAAAAATTLLSMPVGAETLAYGRKSVVVTHADLDLAGADGQKAFHRRIKGAVAQVCGQYQRDLKTNSFVRLCREETLTSAMALADAITQRRGSVTVTAMR